MGAKIPSLKTYLITWYGPFHSISEIKEYEHAEGMDFKLYLFQGKKKNARNYSYYCGRTKRSASTRCKDKYHHIGEISTKLNIWVGCFRNSYKVEDIKIVENLLIDILSQNVKETQLLNVRSVYFQPQTTNLYLLNQWNNPYSYTDPENCITKIMPEVVVYDSMTDTIKICKKLQTL